MTFHKSTHSMRMLEMGFPPFSWKIRDFKSEFYFVSSTSLSNLRRISKVTTIPILISRRPMQALRGGICQPMFFLWIIHHNQRFCLLKRIGNKVMRLGDPVYFSLLLLLFAWPELVINATAEPKSQDPKIIPIATRAICNATAYPPSFGPYCNTGSIKR